MGSVKKFNVTLNDWMKSHPREWQIARDAVLEVIETKNPKKIAEWEQKINREQKNLAQQTHRGLPPHQAKNFGSKLIQLQIQNLLLNEYYQRLSHQHLEGSRPLSFRDRWICNFLFFRQNLARKPVSLRWFKILWPFVQQKSRFLSLVYKSGIYCFFSKSLISRIVQITRGQSTLEIAAGDGSLSRMLNNSGAKCLATDDHSWTQQIKFPEDVENLDAAAALKKHRPIHVICCWPPPGNSFEREVFKTPSVEHYIVMTSRHEFACGDWAAYRSQNDFEMRVDDELSALLLPPEVDPCVLIFERKASQ